MGRIDAAPADSVVPAGASAFAAFAAFPVRGDCFRAKSTCSAAALPLPTFFAAWIVPAGMNRTSPAWPIRSSSYSSPSLIVLYLVLAILLD